jgi:RND family efflux transporter MFP subunit
MKNFLIWIFTALFFAAVGGLCVWVILNGHSPEHEETTAEHESNLKPQLTRDQAGNTVLTMDSATQQRIGLEVGKLSSATRRPEITAYGTLREDPSSTFTVRAPIVGTLRTSESTAWPRIGDMLPVNTTVGTLQPRLGPTERADLAARLNEAHAQVEEVQASLIALRSSYNNKRELNAQNKLVSDQELQDTEAKLKGEEARLEGALNTAQILQSYLATTSQPAANIPLTAGISGQVVEILAQPGEAVESGQAILRLARFDRFIARVSLPAGQALKEPVGKCRIVVAGYEGSPLEAEAAASTLESDSTTGGQTFLFTVNAADLHLQPGMAVTAYLPSSAEVLPGVNVPRSAILRFIGKTWAYVKSADEQFTRHDIALEMPTPDGWFTRDLKPGDTVVTNGAQSLLSQEIKLQTTGGEEEEE